MNLYKMCRLMNIQYIPLSYKNSFYLPTARVFVGRGSPAGVYVSHMTRILSRPSERGRKGSLKIAWGFKITSESSPGACPVEDPSKFHLGSLSTDAARSGVRVRVLERVLPSASTQTYSAIILSEGKGRASYLAITAGSSADCPVSLGRSTLSDELLVVTRVETLTEEGAKADAVERYEKKRAAVNFMFGGLYLFSCNREREREK
jgi:hypothetical protein